MYVDVLASLFKKMWWVSEINDTKKKQTGKVHDLLWKRFVQVLSILQLMNSPTA